MRTNFGRDQNAMRKRAMKASLVALVIFGGGFAWHNVSSERIALRAEQARVAALRMTPKKLAALEREAALDAAAKAFAEKQQAELQARLTAEDPARAQAQRVASSTEG
jgi:hypothetical protein